MDNSVSILWFRKDLRLDDHPALDQALRAGKRVVPVFIWDPEYEQPWVPGTASRWWLNHSLQSLDRDLKQMGSRLIFRKGKTIPILDELIGSTRAASVYWHRRFEPAVADRDTLTIEHLNSNGIRTEVLNGSLLREPESVRKENGEPYRVFTPYWKAHLRADSLRMAIPPPRQKLAPVDPSIRSDRIDICGHDDAPPVPSPHEMGFNPGESGAKIALQRFSREWVEDYDTSRDRPDLAGTSRLSAHLAWGEISPIRIWHTLANKLQDPPVSNGSGGAHTFLKEIGWREFAYHLLVHFPKTPEEPLRGEFRHFPWRIKPEALEKWKSGRTGFPMVDAGMRELLHSGWMHNRVRMLTASFLVKNLGISWLEGARWFWDRLFDADLANNTLGWQWTAGCGADAAPFFRVFNPVIQGQKFDPAGIYVRQWIPELAQGNNRYIHTPWMDPSMDDAYPDRMLSLIESRQRALNDFASLSTH